MELGLSKLKRNFFFQFLGLKSQEIRYLLLKEVLLIMLFPCFGLPSTLQVSRGGEIYLADVCLGDPEEEELSQLWMTLALHLILHFFSVDSLLCLWGVCACMCVRTRVCDGIM